MEKGAHARDGPTWRHVPCSAVDAFTAMALEEVAVGSVADGGPPTVGLWTWEHDAVTIGRFQCAEEEVDLEAVRATGCHLTRRMSGGGAMYHARGAEVAFSITCPEGMLGAGGIRRSYEVACGLVVDALSGLGLHGRVEAVNSVLVGDRKVSGNAQRRSRGVIQHHGTLLHRADALAMSRVLLAGRAPPARRGTPSRPFPVAGVEGLCHATLVDVVRALENALLDGRDGQREGWTREELRAARALAASRYSSPGWVLSR
jgi:lipoate-protein ligase A